MDAQFVHVLYPGWHLNDPEHEKEDVQSGGRRRRAPEKRHSLPEEGRGNSVSVRRLCVTAIPPDPVLRRAVNSRRLCRARWKSGHQTRTPARSLPNTPYSIAAPSIPGGLWDTKCMARTKRGAFSTLEPARVQRMEPRGTAAMCVRPCVLASVAARSVWGSVVRNIVWPAGVWQSIPLG